VPPARRSAIGAHVAVAGGLSRALTHAERIGAEVVQLFVANPRAWQAPTVDEDVDAGFAEACADRDLAVYVHAPYLVNFGSPSPQTLANSAGALRFSLARARRIGARGVVVHAGSAVGGSWETAMAQVRRCVLPVLDAVPGVPLLVEPTAGGGGALASDAASLAGYLDVLDRDERVGVCLDTCHMHAAGHDLSTARGFAAALRAFGTAAGRGRIGLVHVNDSRDPAGSRRDRHESLGAGSIGAEPFAQLFSAPALRGVPLVVETEESSHEADVATLRRLRGPA
jgi:deoxyribonuclease-4